MQIPVLDDEAKKIVNSVPLLEAGQDYTYYKQLHSYGIDAIIHFYLMRVASDIPKGLMSKEDFIKKYKATLGAPKASGAPKSDVHLEIYEHGFSVLLNAIDPDELFLPDSKFIYKNGERQKTRLWLFRPDRYTKIIQKDWKNKDKEYAFNLLSRDWAPEDLANEEVLEQGRRFGIDMWQTRSLDELTQRSGNLSPRVQKITDAGIILINYYNSFISNYFEADSAQTVKEK